MVKRQLGARDIFWYVVNATGVPPKAKYLLNVGTNTTQRTRAPHAFQRQIYTDMIRNAGSIVNLRRLHKAEGGGTVKGPDRSEREITRCWWDGSLQLFGYLKNRMFAIKHSATDNLLNEEEVCRFCVPDLCVDSSIRTCERCL